jgi:hypothetical protein
MISSNEASSLNNFLSGARMPQGPRADKNSQCTFAILILAQEERLSNGELKQA